VGGSKSLHKGLLSAVVKLKWYSYFFRYLMALRALFRERSSENSVATSATDKSGKTKMTITKGTNTNSKTWPTNQKLSLYTLLSSTCLMYQYEGYNIGIRMMSNRYLIDIQTLLDIKKTTKFYFALSDLLCLFWQITCF
jgi:hypothetical protein